MAILVRVAEAAYLDGQQHGISRERIDREARDVESKQSTTMFDRFPAPCLTRKQVFGRNYRLVAADLKVGKHLVVVFLRLLIKSSAEYSKLRKDPANYVTRYLDEDGRSFDTAAWILDRTRVDPPPPLPPPSEAEQNLLWGGAAHVMDEEVMIYETQEWIDAIRDPRIQARLVNLPDALLRMVDQEIAGTVLAIGPTPPVKIIYRSFPEQRRRLLLSALFDPGEEAILEVEEQWAEQLDCEPPPDILRLSARGYPAILLIDADRWVQIEHDVRANLVLSPEEAGILEGVQRLGVRDGQGYPLFINGRAGSGKSTILQYLFAGCFAHWCHAFNDPTSEDGRPIYLACSAQLLEVARTVVRCLLECNHEMMLRHDAQPMPSEALMHLDLSFRDFHKFLYEYLTEEEQSCNFPRDHHVEYPQFRRLWERRFGREPRARRDYGPQISWHVIRSFIKGLSVDETLDVDGYDELPQNERTVSSEGFVLIYTKVWDGWYKQIHEQEKIWDDQDLARFLLDEDRIKPRYCGIFCDESQDFTRIEIELLYRLSLFSGREVPPDIVSRVPFAFAGDPFQTLNPTGFRWDAMKSGFTERLLRSLHRYQELSTLSELNYRELTYNYRSSPNIVRFCNTLQALRAGLFDLTSLSPQSSWVLEKNSPMAVYFPADDPGLQSAIRQQAELVIIIPCEEGEEAEFVRNDPILSSLVAFEGDTPNNVLSPIRAKGLEFKRVVLYCFGEQEEARAIFQWVSQRGLSQPPDRDSTLPLAYFMNRLYVAASRAQQRLVIVDSRSALDTFWKFAHDEAENEKILHLLPKQGEAWRDHIGTTIPGRSENWMENRDDPAQLARQFEEEGLRGSDPYLLTLAAHLYEELGEVQRENFCRALAAYHSDKFTEAGAFYEKAGMSAKALAAYWEGKAFHEIRDLGKRDPTLARWPECRAADLIEGTINTPDQVSNLLGHFHDNARDSSDFASRLTTPGWAFGLQAILQCCLKVSRDATADPTPWRRLGGHVEALRELGATFSTIQLGDIALRGCRYENALDLLAKEPSNDLYKEAKVRLLLQQKEQGNAQFTVEDARQVATFLLQDGKKTTGAQPTHTKPYAQAAWWSHLAEDYDRVWECLTHLIEEPSRDDLAAADVLGWALEGLVVHGAWSELVSYCQTGRRPPKVSDRLKGTRIKLPNWSAPQAEQLVSLIREQGLLRHSVIPALARSDRLAQDSGDEKRKVSALTDPILLENHAHWRSDVPLPLAGAAVERVGKDLDALRFYERIKDDRSFNLRERDFAGRRWVRCKLRQAKRERSEDYRKAAEEELTRLGLTEQDLPDFPEVTASELLQWKPQVPLQKSSKARPLIEPPKGQAWTSGDLTFKVFHKQHRINIESSATGDCARVDMKSSCLESEDLPVEHAPGAPEWTCPGWGLRVIFTDEAVEIVTSHSQKRIPIESRNSDRTN